MFAVFDGAPNVGKSTIIDMLGGIGCPVMKEIALTVINEGVHKPWLGDVEQLAFQEEVAHRQVAAEAKLGQLNGVVYLDRGLVAAIAYRLVYGRPLTSLHRNMTADQYSVAFVFDPVEGWDDNGVRYEDPHFSRAMTPVMKHVYESYGVPVVSVPNMSKADRLQLITSTISKICPATVAPIWTRSEPQWRMAA
jgi:predicted ATPase